MELPSNLGNKNGQIHVNLDVRLTRQIVNDDIRVAKDCTSLFKWLIHFPASHHDGVT
jgi:hypothetical protein